MKCLDCGGDVKICNECLPKPQRKKNHGHNATFNSLSVFRAGRNEAIFIKSDELNSLTDKILYTMLKSNIVVTEKNNDLPFDAFFEKLCRKIMSNKMWQDCALCRFLLIEPRSFEAAEKFFAGENVVAPKSRGALMT